MVLLFCYDNEYKEKIIVSNQSIRSYIYWALLRNVDLNYLLLLAFSGSTFVCQTFILSTLLHSNKIGFKISCCLFQIPNRPFLCNFILTGLQRTYFAYLNSKQLQAIIHWVSTNTYTLVLYTNTLNPAFGHMYLYDSCMCLTLLNRLIVLV